jgi:AbrB-like transcriptional regulator
MVILQMAKKTEMEPLTGKALLQKLKDIPHLSRREKARECGYFSFTEDNRNRVNIGAFLNAVLEAKGVSLDSDDEKDGRGREATYRAVVHKNGQIVIGSAYTQGMNLEPGDEFEIKLGYKHIHLVKISHEHEED